MRKIYPLPEYIISRIAAGEVIERPVYAVKELIENSLDAGADSITIQIEQSGIKKIIVTDNGEGMDKDDLLESFKPHTTSKLSDESLIGIRTLGFRGEALSSIASVSDMMIQSRVPQSPHGNQVILKSGTVEKSGPVGMPAGTSITVANLFYTVPARKKFLRSEKTEFRKILELISNFAIVFPHVRFLLVHNKKVVIDFPKNHDVNRRVSLIFGSRIYEHLLPIKHSDDYCEIYGYIARPQISSKSLSRQYLFVNGRFVKDKSISSAVREAYGNLLEKNKYPVFILFFKIPPEIIDVNVHPRKEQVSFVNSDMIYVTVKNAVTKTLSDNNLVFKTSSKFSPVSGYMKTETAYVLKDSIEKWNVKDVFKLINKNQIQQFNDTYIIAQSKRGLIIVDQHAAHERVLYEQYLDSYKTLKSKKNVLKLKTPIRVNLSIVDYDVVRSNTEMFNSSGFEINLSKKNLELLSVPKLFSDQDYEKLLLELIDDLREKGKFSETISFVNTILEFLACKNAVKSGDRLSQVEAESLMRKLEQTKNNSTCPHGRPTTIEIGTHELDKWFKRK